MEEFKVIKSKNLPTKLPLLFTVVSILCLDYYKAPGWAWGVVLTLLTILWIVCFVRLFKEESVDIFDKKSDHP